MELDGCFSAPELCPREEGQAKIDGRGIEGVNRLFQVDSQRIFDVQFSGVCNEDLSKVGVNAPVAILVGLGQSVACDTATKAKVIKFGFHRIQAGFDIAQTVSTGQLSKCHAEKLIETRELPDTIIALVLADAAIEIALRQRIHELREEILPDVHRQVLSTGICGKVYEFPRGKVEIDADGNSS